VNKLNFRAGSFLLVCGGITVTALGGCVNPGGKGLPAGSSVVSSSDMRELTISGPTSVTHGQCSGPFVATVKNEQGNAFDLTTNGTLPQVYTAFVGIGSTLYSDSACKDQITSLEIAERYSSVAFYYNAEYAGNFSIPSLTTLLESNGTNVLLSTSYKLTIK